jgi:hypothetical protein
MGGIWRVRRDESPFQGLAKPLATIYVITAQGTGWCDELHVCSDETFRRSIAEVSCTGQQMAAHAARSTSVQRSGSRNHVQRSGHVD